MAAQGMRPDRTRLTVLNPDCHGIQRNLSYTVYKEVCAAGHWHPLDPIAWYNPVGISHAVDEGRGKGHG
jgi:hypothetical protein